MHSGHLSFQYTSSTCFEGSAPFIEETIFSWLGSFGSPVKLSWLYMISLLKGSLRYSTGLF